MTKQPLPRVICIGDSGVGKTSIITRATTGTFDPSPPSTIGAGVRPITVTSGGEEYKFHLWDTAGQEIYRSIVPLYFKQATCALVVFSMDDSNSFGNLTDWIDLLYSHTGQNIPVVIVGNKIDIEKQVFEITEIKKWAESKKYPYFFTSAATGRGINELFEFVTQYISKSSQADTQKMPTDNDTKVCC